MEGSQMNNKVRLEGEIASKFVFNHEAYGEAFYEADLAIERKSGVKDYVPLLISECLLDTKKDYTGTGVYIEGQLRTHNHSCENRSRLQIDVFVQYLAFAESVRNINDIQIEGYIVKEPTFRQTPLGRDISDLMVAVNRSYGKSDYIPCICWGRNAFRASYFKVGDRIRLSGRVQSREYQKKISETESETRIAYEVSVSHIELTDRREDYGQTD